jgi:hypothetical protein
MKATKPDQPATVMFHPVVVTCRCPHGLLTRNGACQGAYRRAKALHQPVIMVHPRRTYASVDMDLITTAFDMTRKGADVLRAWFHQHVPMGYFGVGGCCFAGTFSAFTRLRIEHVPEVLQLYHDVLRQPGVLESIRLRHLHGAAS